MVSTVIIGTDSFSIYGTNAGADSYLNARAGVGTTWTGLSEDDQNRALVSATRQLDLQTYEGTITAAAIAAGNQFPRTGLTDRDGNDPGSASEPPEVTQATYELAYQASQSSSVVTTGGTPGQEFRRLKAGSAEVEYFRPQTQASLSAPGSLSNVVLALIRPYLASLNSSGIGAGGADSWGTGEASQFDDCDRSDVTEGYA